MHFNTGYQREALMLARRFVRVFGDAEAVVAPSASCVAMVRHVEPLSYRAGRGRGVHGPRTLDVMLVDRSNDPSPLLRQRGAGAARSVEEEAAAERADGTGATNVGPSNDA